ncbi:hypothetical protein B0H19DRAFT_857394, partial [Mycena capillaripes]
MLKCMNKYGISFEAVLPTEAIRREMPFWHHPGETAGNKRSNNGKKANCLRRNHNIKTLGNALDLTGRLETPAHENSASCVCSDCIDDRTTRSCKDPNACVIAAADRMKCFLPKWVVEKPGEADTDERTANQDPENGEAR